MRVLSRRLTQVEALGEGVETTRASRLRTQ
jgi:hypothetical protein